MPSIVELQLMSYLKSLITFLNYKNYRRNYICIMGSPVVDEDFVMILITLLPEAWDNYTSAYLGSSRNKPEL